MGTTGNIGYKTNVMSMGIDGYWVLMKMAKKLSRKWQYDTHLQIFHHFTCYRSGQPRYGNSLYEVWENTD